MKKWIACVLLAVLLCGCAGGSKVHSQTYLGAFDTVLQVSRSMEDTEQFHQEADGIYQAMMEYHRLFDIYNTYPQMNNLKTVNDQAGGEPVAVDRRIIELLLDCKVYYEATDGRVNVAMGGVLRLWHDARTDALAHPETAGLPDQAALEEAAKHCSWDTILIDTEQGTVQITDPAQSLDVGAVAKGWAVQKVAESLPAGWLINMGGNVCATGPKDGAGMPWVVGINDPDDSSAYLAKVTLQTGSAVTSGDYQRYFTVDGVDYHHIIDPQTLMPSSLWRSVSILCADSGVADALTTALFLSSREEGQRLLERYDAEAMWIDEAGNCYYSPGFEARLQK